MPRALVAVQHAVGDTRQRHVGVQKVVVAVQRRPVAVQYFVGDMQQRPVVVQKSAAAAQQRVVAMQNSVGDTQQRLVAMHKPAAAAQSCLIAGVVWCVLVPIAGDAHTARLYGCFLVVLRGVTGLATKGVRLHPDAISTWGGGDCSDMRWHTLRLGLDFGAVAACAARKSSANRHT